MSTVKTKQFYILLVLIRLGVTSQRKPSLRLAPRHTAQTCIGGESITTFVNLTNSGIEPSKRSNARKQEPLSPSRILYICIINDLMF